MIDHPDTQARIGRIAFATAWIALVFGQLHALARHRTADGREDLDSALVRWWSDPARHALRPLLDWASPDTVYLTYGKGWFVVVATFTLAAFVVRRRRVDSGVVHGAETWAWRVALTAYCLAALAVGLEYWTQWGAMDDGLLDAIFLLSMPAVLLTLLASTFLGIVLVRRGLGLPAWLLALEVPLAIGIGAITAMGNILLPIAFAFGILGRRVTGRRPGHGTVATSPNRGQEALR